MCFHSFIETWAPFQYKDCLIRCGNFPPSKDFTAVRQFYLYNGNPYTGKMISLYWWTASPGFPWTRFEKFQWFFNDISRQKSQISMTIMNVSKWKNTGPHITHGLLTHLMTIIIKKIYKVFLPDWMYNISVNNEYVKYIFIYPCS